MGVCKGICVQCSPIISRGFREQIRQVMVQIPNAMLVRVMRNYVKRLNQLIAADGEHIEVQYYS